MADPGQSDERRRVPRFALRVEARLRERGATIRVPVRVIDISPFGCRIEHGGGQTMQDTAWLYLDKLDGIYARIVWHRGIFAGLEFETPLHEAVIDTLLGDEQRAGEPSVAELHSLAQRSHNMAIRAGGAPVSRDLRALAHDCAVSALDRVTKTDLN